MSRALISPLDLPNTNNNKNSSSIHEVKLRFSIFHLVMAGSHNEVQVPFNFEGGRLLELAVQSDVRIEDNVDENISQDRAGAFSYKHCRHYSRTTRNRSIFW